MKKILIYAVGVFAWGSFFSCGNESPHEETKGTNRSSHATQGGMQMNEEEASHKEEETKVLLTQEQIERVGIQWGEFSQMKINQFVKSTGFLDVPANAIFNVHAKTEGFVVMPQKYLEGDFVRKGEVIFYIEDVDLLKRQQAYLETTAELEFLRLELRRQQILEKAQAGVVKTLQKLQSQVKQKEVSLKSMEKQLLYIGILPDSLTAKNMSERVAIKAPISGYITTISTSNGQHVTPQESLMTLIQDAHLHLELNVFEKDIAKIRAGQKISFTSQSLNNKVHYGEVHSIGKQLDSHSQSIRVHGHCSSKRPFFIRGMFIQAKIWLNDQTVTALPTTALIEEGDAAFIFVIDEKNTSQEELLFEKVKVAAENSANGFTEIKLLNELPKNKKVVTQGAYFIQAQSVQGTLEHSH